MLFQIDLTQVTPEQVFQEFWISQPAPAESKAFAEGLVRGVNTEQQRLDDLIATAAEHWRVGRMAVVDRNVLRMAVYELLHDAEVPPAVVIDEAIEIAKKFGSAESGSFINGILDAVRRRTKPDRGAVPRADGSSGP
jgi:N utilization substance protein B